MKHESSILDEGSLGHMFSFIIISKLFLRIFFHNTNLNTSHLKKVGRETDTDVVFGVSAPRPWHPLLRIFYTETRQELPVS